MKKFFPYFCYLAMAIAAVSFVSCGDDDEFDGPSKDPSINDLQLKLYAATLGNETLDVVDIKLNMYRNGKKQTVVLTKSMLSPLVPTVMTSLFTRSSIYYCTSVNGEQGVDSVIAEVSAKPNIKDIVASHNPEDTFAWAGKGDILKVTKIVSGDYSNLCVPKNEHINDWDDVFEEHDGQVLYDRIIEEVQTNMTAK